MFAADANGAVSFVFHGSGRIRTPLLPASHEHFDLRITCQLQSKRLDRGPPSGLSARYGGLIGLYPALAEQCS